MSALPRRVKTPIPALLHDRSAKKSPLSIAEQSSPNAASPRIEKQRKTGKLETSRSNDSPRTTKGRKARRRVRIQSPPEESPTHEPLRHEPPSHNSTPNAPAMKSPSPRSLSPAHLLVQAGEAPLDPVAAFLKAERGKGNDKQTTVEVASDDGQQQPKTSPQEQPAHRNEFNLPPLDPSEPVVELNMHLPPVPSISNELPFLPGMFLAKTVETCRPSTVYKKLRTLTYNYHSDLEDFNKKRAQWWLKWIEALEELVVDMRNSMSDMRFRERLPYYMEVLGGPKRGLVAIKSVVKRQLMLIAQYTGEAYEQMEKVSGNVCS